MPCRALPQVLCVLVLATISARAEPGDAESSHDYPGFARQTGFLISDFTEDNPSDFNFPVAHPLPTDAAHVEITPVTGHRYIIRYELTSGNAPSLFQTQRYYEKLASDGGFKIEKSGAVGDTSETFHKSTAAHEIWIHLEPSITINTLTIVEAAGSGVDISTPPTSPRIAATTPSVHAPEPPVVATPSVPPVSVTRVPTAPPVSTPPVETATRISTHNPVAAPIVAPVAPPPPAPVIADPEGDALYDQLNKEGRIVVPFVFRPAKDELDSSSQPLVTRVAAMMKKHADLSLRIEGHTDNSGDQDVNLRLSAQRALAIQSALTDAHVDKKRLDAVGVGGLQPVADNITPQGREKNRRIELVMWKRAGAHTPPTGGG